MPLLPALALRLTVGREDDWARHNATEALNGQLWLLVLWNGFLAPVFLAQGRVPSWALWCFLGAFVSMASIYLMAIIHTVQASRGRWWRYPLPFRVVPGSVRRPD
jgi:uncharacterized Tic20 family protein